ncbi:MAG: HD domain-containing protein [Lachnospiraceae bacterium]|nr:HD domain-containing protein [Lachnospiraceae bacterium]
MRKDIFQTLLANWNRHIELDSMLTDSKVDLTEKMLIERSKELQRLYLENNELISEFEEALSKTKDEPWTPEEADYIYESTMEMYYGDFDDLHLMKLLLETLIDYYNKNKDFSKLVNLFAVRFYHNIEVLDRFTRKVDPQSVVEDAAAVLGYRAFYNQLTLEARRKVFVIYYNLCVVGMDANKIDIDTSCYYLQEMLMFYKSPMVQALDREDERISSMPERTVKEWLEFHKHLKDASEETRKYFTETADRVYAEEMSLGKKDYEISYETYGAHVAVMTNRGEITPEEGFDLLAKYYVDRRDYLMKSGGFDHQKLVDMSYEYMDYLYFYMNTPQLLLNWIETYSIPREKTLAQAKMYLSDLHRMWNELYANLPGPFLDGFIHDACLTIIAVDDDETLQLEWLEKFLVKRDIPTYIHSVMVSDFTRVLATDMLENQPELFEGVWGYSVDEVVKNKDEIIDYITNAALYHDIGKTRIGNVINTQTRKIDDFEFEIIKSHPSEGAALLDKVPILLKYKDVILGHHKAYDGSFGYPADFDNTKSEVRPVIDLVTICDCLDAATDHLGRNYSNTKTVADVFEEIYEQRGSRYNPYMAEYLYKAQNLQKTLDTMATRNRISKYMDILKAAKSEFDLTRTD